MRLKILVGALFVLATTGRADGPKAPLTLSIVPSRSSTTERSISTADKQPEVFYVVLTNVSDRPQPVWESWNEWGYQNVSFEVILPDGKLLAVTKKEQEFTLNYPSIFVIPPGEQQVYPIQLDAEWENCPLPAGLEGVPVTLKAIYDVVATPESATHGVWTGRVESAGSRVVLKHWTVPRPPA